MKRTLFVCALMAATAIALGAQEVSSSGPYQGISNPPPDNSITTQPADAVPQAKPSPIHRAPAPAAAPRQSNAAPPVQSAPPPDAAESAPVPSRADGTDAGIVQVAPPDSPSQPALDERAAIADPDGDIVHPAPPSPDELPEGTTIRVRLLNHLSTADNEAGDSFRAQVASDVVRDSRILIPVGSMIDGKVASVSTGHTGGHGSMRLLPESITLPDGARFRLYAQLAGAPETSNRVGSEGQLTPGSRLKKDGIQYGAGVGVGAVTGALLGGPGGAIAGSIVGASLVSVHLLVSHPQAHLDSGTILLFNLSEPLSLVPAPSSGN